MNHIHISPGIVFFTISLLFGLTIGFMYSRMRSGVSADTVRVILSDCMRASSENGYFSCLRKRFRAIVRPANLSAIMDDVQLHTSKNQFIPTGKSGSLCHEVGHIIGEIAGASGSPILYLVDACGSTCGYGCTHGVMVGKLRQNPHALDTPDTVCASSPKFTVSVGDLIACRHGTGHAYAEYTSYNVNTALQYCQRFRAVQAQEECAEGVFMEVFEAPTLIHTPISLPSDVLSFCASIPGYASVPCVRSVAAETFTATKDIRKGNAICAYSAPADYRDCLGAVGAQVYSVTLADAPSIVETCAQDLPHSFSCLQGAITSSLIIDATGASGGKICDAVAVDMQKACRDYIAAEGAYIRHQLP